MWVAVEEVAELMHRGAQARTVAATLLNSESSRSHAVFQLHIELRSQPNEHGIRQISRPRLTLVDLAGLTPTPPSPPLFPSRRHARPRPGRARTHTGGSLLTCTNVTCIALDSKLSAFESASLLVLKML